MPSPDDAAPRFVIFERLLAEAAGGGGTSPTQDRWTQEAKERLAALRAERLSPKDERALSRIETAFDEARDLLGRCLSGVPRPPARS